MKIRLRYGFFVFCLSFGFWGCASQPVATVESGPAAASNRRVLVATQNSKFKQALVSEIHDELNQNSIYLKIIDVKRLKNQSGTEFSAVVIINKCMAGRIPGWKALLTANPKKIKSFSVFKI